MSMPILRWWSDTMNWCRCWSAVIRANHQSKFVIISLMKTLFGLSLPRLTVRPGFCLPNPVKCAAESTLQ